MSVVAIRRTVLRALATWSIAGLAGQALLWLASAVARSGRPPSRPRGGPPGLAGFRVVDEHVWAGAQPTPDQYRSLAGADVRTVVDLRCGSAGDPILDEPEQLRDLGIAHAPIPIVDGRAPTPGEVALFAEAVRGSAGTVFLHCGAGVGRTTSMQAGYLAETGRRLPIVECLGFGPPTLEQLAFMAACRPGYVPRVSPVLRLFSRSVFDLPRLVYGRVRAIVGSW